MSLLAIGHLAVVQRRDGAAGDVLGKLLERRPGPPGEAVALVGEALLDVGATGVPAARRAQVLAALRAQMQDRAIPPRLRLAAGILLADLGDLPPDLDAFVPIAAAAQLGYDFRIGKYPVSNIQFRRFVAAGGYGQKQPWWKQKAIDEIMDFQKRFADGAWPDGPRYWDNDRFNHATQPVVGVSWYEALAYCKWLTGELRQKGKIGQDEEVRLPREAEWMRAALPPSNSPRSGGRADRAAVDDLYPWGSADFDPARANTEESDLKQTTPVQMYPEGASAAGVWDLAGNVWEWSADWNEDKYPWLKGGGFWDNSKNTVTSSRVGSDPDFRNFNGGFRVVVVPISHG